MENAVVLGNKGILRNEKGLTLVELLAVIVIIGIIGAIATLSISGLIDKSKKESHRANARLIIEAAKMKIATEDFTPDGIGSNDQTIYVAQLNEEGYLEKVPFDPENKNQKYTASATAGTPPTYSGSLVKATRGTNGKLAYSILLIGKRNAGADVAYLSGATATDPLDEDLITSAPIK